MLLDRWPVRRGRCLALLCALALALVGCGDDAPSPGPGPGPGTAAKGTGAKAHAEPKVPPLSDVEKARYALERLSRGPAPTRGLHIGDLHRKNLNLARMDLASVPEAALEILSDEKLIERLTTAHPNNQDPWHNVLSVLAAVRGKPADLVTRWTQPALKSPFATLRRQASRVLVSEAQEAHAPLLLDFLRRDASDRAIGQQVFRALVRFGETWRRRALDIVLRRGSPLLWTRVAAGLEAAEPPEARGGDLAAAMFWWQAVVEGGGPQLPSMLPRVKRFPWVTQERMARDPAFHRAVRDGQSYPRAPFPRTHDGWIEAPLAEAGLFPTYAFILSGTTPAADARCVLARLGMPTFKASVLADRTRDKKDPLYRKALHCMLPGDEAESMKAVAAELEEMLHGIVAEGHAIEPQAMGRLVEGLPNPTDVASAALMKRVVYELPPQPAARLVVEKASDRLRVLGPDWVEFLNGMLASDDHVARGRALRLILRANDVRFIDGLEAHMERLPEAEREGLYQRLVFLYASGQAEPRRTETFVRGLLKRLETAPEAHVRGMASALLDFGEIGAESFAAGLRGPRRRLYLESWPGGHRQVPLIVARAAIEPLDAKSDPAEVAAVLSVAYHSFPESAAPALAALKQRLGTGHRTWVDPVLERVRHRAFH